MKTILQIYTCRIAFGVFMVLLVTGCDLFGSSDDPEPGTLSVAFHHYANNQELTLEQSSHTSAAGHSFTVTLLEYIITELSITHEDGTVVILEDAQYINHADPASGVIASPSLEPGHYTSISFTYGIKATDNVFGTLDRTADMDNMLWPMMPPMGDGSTERYHYMRFEGRYGTDGTFRIHTGPSGGNDFSFDVVLPIDIEIDGDGRTLQIDMHLEQWLTGPNEWDFDDYGMIMGNANAQGMLRANGASVFQISN